MGFIFRKRVNLGRSVHMNVSGHGASVSKKVGPITVNSRGHISIRLAKGLSFRIR